MKSAKGDTDLKIAHCDNHLLAVDKPAGLPSQPDASGDPSLVDLAREYVRARFNKPGNVYLALLHRLDRPTSGLVLLARTDKAAGRMADLFRRRDIEKSYLAVVAAPRSPGDGTLHDLLAPADNGTMKPATTGTKGAKEARLSYRTLAADAGSGTALLRIALETGVKHQIRCQLAQAGMPVLGDFRYGVRGSPAHPDPVANGHAILLHAHRVAFVHPVRREPTTIVAPPPDHWREYLRRFSVGDLL